MSDVKIFKLSKNVPGDVFFNLSPLSNPAITRTIHLSDRTPFQMLPQDYALGMFIDNAAYDMYKKGIVTFVPETANDELAKIAFANGAYFDEKLDFTPTDNHQKEIIEILQSGDRAKINQAVEQYGKDLVRNIAIVNKNSLSMNVIQMLEGIFKIQLIMDGGEGE